MLLALLVAVSLFIGLALYCYYTYWVRARERALCPYTRRPMRFGTEISYTGVEKVLRFLHYEVRGYDNRIFKMRRALVCRDTGRIFPDTVSWSGRPKIDWSFIKKRYPGNFVSWGSLNPEQQQEIRESHEKLEGFQTENSSPEPAPRAVTPEYAYTIPGPLYVDPQTKVLMGWKCVPNSPFEVLVIQKPKQGYGIAY